MKHVLPNIKVPKTYDANTDRTEERNREGSTIVGNFNTTPSMMNTTTRQKISKETDGLNNTRNRLDLKDIQNTPPNNGRIHIFLNEM